MDKMQVNFQFTGVIFFVHESIVLKNYAENEEVYCYDFPRYKKGWHEIFMSINSIMILTYCLSYLMNLIRFPVIQFYHRHIHDRHHYGIQRIVSYDNRYLRLNRLICAVQVFLTYSLYIFTHSSVQLIIKSG